MTGDYLELHARADTPGKVYLVGAGPGEPDLLTLRALRVIEQADVVVHDRLVSKQVLALVPSRAELIYAGKARSNHHMPQHNINALLLRLALEGKTVVRLKGGDPFIFGRGGEEIIELAREGVAFEVVPGVTAASGCAAYAGIPLTHRDHAHACVFVAGFRKHGAVALDWTALAKPNQTVVVYMGLDALPEVCSQLVAHGMPANTPAALVGEGTTANQRVAAGTLKTLPGIVAAANMETPTLIIIGGVVSLRAELNWFEADETPATVATPDNLAAADCDATHITRPRHPRNED